MLSKQVQYIQAMLKDYIISNTSTRFAGVFSSSNRNDIILSFLDGISNRYISKVLGTLEFKSGQTDLLSSIDDAVDQLFNPANAAKKYIVLFADKSLNHSTLGMIVKKANKKNIKSVVVLLDKIEEMMYDTDSLMVLDAKDKPHNIFRKGF